MLKIKKIDLPLYNQKDCLPLWYMGQLVLFISIDFRSLQMHSEIKIMFTFKLNFKVFFFISTYLNASEWKIKFEDTVMSPRYHLMVYSWVCYKIYSHYQYDKIKNILHRCVLLDRYYCLPLKYSVRWHFVCGFLVAYNGII